MSTWETDRDYRTATLDEVRKIEDGYVLHFTDNGCLIVDDPGFSPMAGDRVRIYPKSFGSLVRGVVIVSDEPRVIYYRTVREQEKKNAFELGRQRGKREVEFERERADRDARRAALPENFQRRLNRFEAGTKDFRVEYEPYELFVCEEAVRLAMELKTIEAIDAFHALDWDQKRAQIPAISDGHSGNTFGFALRLAKWHVSDPELVVKDHAAIAMLVGCEACGCTH